MNPNPQPNPRPGPTPTPTPSPNQATKEEEAPGALRLSWILAVVGGGSPLHLPYRSALPPPLPLTLPLTVALTLPLSRWGRSCSTGCYSSPSRPCAMSSRTSQSSGGGRTFTLALNPSPSRP